MYTTLIRELELEQDQITAIEVERHLSSIIWDNTIRYLEDIRLSNKEMRSDDEIISILNSKWKEDPIYKLIYSYSSIYNKTHIIKLAIKEYKYWTEDLCYKPTIPPYTTSMSSIYIPRHELKFITENPLIKRYGILQLKDPFIQLERIKPYIDSARIIKYKSVYYIGLILEDLPQEYSPYPSASEMIKYSIIGINDNSKYEEDIIIPNIKTPIDLYTLKRKVFILENQLARIVDYNRAYYNKLNKYNTAKGKCNKAINNFINNELHKYSIIEANSIYILKENIQKH